MRSDTKESIRKLEEVSKGLTAFVLNEANGAINYDVSNGECTGIYVYQEDAICIQRSHLEEGIEFPAHSHEETEILIVYKGKVHFRSDVIGNMTMGPSDIIRIPKNIKHSIYAIEDTWLIGIIIPKGKGYPNGRRNTGGD